MLTVLLTENGIWETRLGNMLSDIVRALEVVVRYKKH